MESRAHLRDFRMAPRKVALVANLVRGKPVGSALNILLYTRKAAAKPMAKLIRSAVANAGVEVEAAELYVKSCVVDGGPSMKRFRPVMRGMAHPFVRRTCHITVELDRIEE